jgi:pantoate--beta-alanine ligase
MKIFRDPRKLQLWCRRRREESRRIALVPTMGYLHEGHLSLIETARGRGADEIVVSIFVNPVQFCPGEDFASYPRDEKSDLAKCRRAGATAVFLPEAGSMYFPDASVSVDENLLSGGLCGARRPGHFRGVCTVVAKLFNLTHPNFAVFGEKDFQQLQVVRRMVRDLNFDLEIVAAPIVREASGLAKSSRNSYLSAAEAEAAAEINRALAACPAEGSWARARGAIVRRLEKASLKVDYVECVDAGTLSPRRRLGPGAAVLVAAFSGRTRLIDNRVF